MLLAKLFIEHRLTALVQKTRYLESPTVQRYLNDPNALNYGGEATSSDEDFS